MSQSPFSSLLQEALAAHRQGSPTRAIPVYERALAQTPDDAEALSLYGLALVQAGRPSEAEKPLRRAVEKEPNQPAFRTNLAELLFRVGENDAAIAELGKATAGGSTYAPAFVRLGRALVDRADLGGAVDAFDRALQLKPGDRQTALMLTRALGATGNYGAAYHVLDHMEKTWPDDLEALRLRLEIARSRRDFSAMRTLSTKLTKLAPEDPMGWRDLAATLFESGLFGDALLAFEKALSLGDRDAESLGQLASISIQALDFSKAEAALAEAEAIDPNNARVLSTKALLLTYQGKKKEAEDYCERCFKADPGFAGVYPQLSLLRNGKLTADEEQTIRDYSRRPDIAAAGRASASFVVAHSLEARGESEAAFAEYVHANAEAAERNRVDLINYDFPGHDAWTDAIISVFPGAAEAGAETYRQGPQPIFVVGLPRCGSTLVESVIAAHSTVEAGGEMPMLPNIFNTWFRENHRAGVAHIPPLERERLAAAYMAGMPSPVSKDRFTDKNLLNIEAAGMIAQIFPKAVIINVRRSPVENCVSIWRQDMMKFWAFATNFEDLASRYGLYARLADHFEQALPGRFHTIQYEDFVSGFDGQARRLIDLCGLPWEAACGDFQKARDIAPTISAIQVREEVSLKSDRADQYGARLDPLRRALEAAGVDLKTGARK
jgi:tetratricopeptide (TPR) repeat protein